MTAHGLGRLTPLDQLPFLYEVDALGVIGAITPLVPAAPTPDHQEVLRAVTRARQVAARLAASQPAQSSSAPPAEHTATRLQEIEELLNGGFLSIDDEDRLYEIHHLLTQGNLSAPEEHSLLWELDSFW